jgi:hypothetical protein
MLFGHNTNVKVGETTYHVQTEDRGLNNALIDTTVYWGGRVLHRRANNYFDLLPLDPDREQALKLRLDEQHRSVLEEIRSGALHLAPPHGEERHAVSAPRPPIETSGPNPTAVPAALTLELTNAKSWLVGNRAKLQISVRGHAGESVSGAKVTARFDGAAEGSEFSAETGVNGQAQLEFDMPRLAGAEPALVIEALHGTAKRRLHFHLRAKSRVPSAR